MVTQEETARLLDDAAQRQIAQGGHLETRSERFAVVVYGRRVNLVLLAAILGLLLVACTSGSDYDAAPPVDYTVISKTVVSPAVTGTAPKAGVYRVTFWLRGERSSIDYSGLEEPSCYAAATVGGTLPTIAGRDRASCH